jgi:riboflavin kinase / FMN adenylyltransferase
MQFKGIVKKFTGRGRELGFPTANIEIGDLDIEDGLYIGLVKIGPSTSSAINFKALIFIGANETFDERNRHAETYILDFDQNLYEQEIEVETIKKIRDVKKFKSADELIAQMKKDEQIAREFFLKYNKNN